MQTESIDNTEHREVITGRPVSDAMDKKCQSRPPPTDETKVLRCEQGSSQDLLPHCDGLSGVLPLEKMISFLQKFLRIRQFTGSSKHNRSLLKKTVLGLRTHG